MLFFCIVVLLAEDVDRNFRFNARSLYNYESSSSRRTWIEMIFADRSMNPNEFVVLLAEDVDRNEQAMAEKQVCHMVVLLAEDVDRNSSVRLPVSAACPSSSSRRTWIEIFINPSSPDRSCVVLLAEDVDRNCQKSAQSWKELPSSSSRRTWIEIFFSKGGGRNEKRRPPRGGRG